MTTPEQNNSTSDPQPLAQPPAPAPARPPDLQVDGGQLHSAVMIRFFMPLLIGVILVMAFAFFLLMMSSGGSR